MDSYRSGNRKTAVKSLLFGHPLVPVTGQIHRKIHLKVWICTGAVRLHHKIQHFFQIEVVGSPVCWALQRPQCCFADVFTVDQPVVKVFSSPGHVPYSCAGLRVDAEIKRGTGREQSGVITKIEDICKNI